MSGFILGFGFTTIGHYFWGMPGFYGGAGLSLFLVIVISLIEYKMGNED